MRILITPWFFLTNYRYKRYTPKSKTFLVLTNHNTNWDFFLAGLVIRRRHMYFVGSEHIVRAPVTGPIVRFLGDPIPRKKGASGDEVVKLILERLRNGSNVCMMAEGNRSFTGETCFISPRTADLVKESGVGLITVAIHGGYFVSPRWSASNRRGKYYGEVVNEYTAEEIAGMDTEEIIRHIRSDLYINAYEDQSKLNEDYVCSSLAENLETALFSCPECGSFSTLHSRKDVLSCSFCGNSVRFTTKGYFEPCGSSTAKFKTVLDWSAWQTDYLHERLSALDLSSPLPIFTDEGITLSAVRSGVGAGSDRLTSGKMGLCPDRFEFSDSTSEKTVSFPVKSIQKISVLKANTMFFTSDTGYYQVNGSAKYCALKYLIASRFLNGKEYK